MKPIFKILLMAIAYLAMFVMGATSGLIHPMCYAYIGALLSLVSAFIYLYTSTLIQGFGVATILNGFILLLFLLAGEADATLIIGFVVLTALSEGIRWYCQYNTIKGVRRSFVPFAFSFFAYTGHWWTDTESSLAAAVEEMPVGYDQLMKPVIDNVPALIVVLLLTIPISLFAMRMAERVLKKHTEGLR